MSEHHTMHDPQKLDRYLLGRLSEEESDALEADLLRDRRLFDLAEAAEDDLVDRYVRGELPEEDRKRLERHLLPSERIRERIAVARALTAWTDGARTAARTPPSVFRRPARLAWAAALIAAIAAGALGFEVIRLHDRLDERTPAVRSVEARVAEDAAPDEPAEAVEPSADEPAPIRAAVDEETPDAAPDAERERIARLERELTTARERIASLESDAAPASARGDAADPSTVTAFLMLVTRGVDDEERIDLGAAERAEILLEIGRRRPSGKVLATVTRGGEVIWRETGVEVVSEAGESMARLHLPREVLLGGRHRVELIEVSGEGGGEDRTLGTYSFSVTR